MSRLDELIAELCPDGVKYRKLEDVIISLTTGLNPRKFFTLNTKDANNYYQDSHRAPWQFSAPPKMTSLYLQSL